MLIEAGNLNVLLIMAGRLINQFIKEPTSFPKGTEPDWFL
jgi:hypothetical protein